MITPRIDWRTLPAGRELDRVIAERLGDYTPYINVGGRVIENFPPAYSTDANAALSLWSDDYRWSISPTEVSADFPVEDESRFQASYPRSGNPDRSHEWADTPALAICRAWLTWQEGQG